MLFVKLTHLYVDDVKPKCVMRVLSSEKEFFNVSLYGLWGPIDDSCFQKQ